MDYQAYSGMYDAEYADYTDDIHFYIKWARRCPPPALELGCGTGRILLPMAHSGCQVTGLDNCQAMLELARRKLLQAPKDVAARVDLVQGDMREFQLDREFGLIYLPFREFMHLDSEQDQLSCLESIHRHLSLDGRLIVNLYNMDLVALANQSTSDVPLHRQRGGDYTDPETGHRVYLSSASLYQVESQTLKEERFYDRVDSNGVVVERKMVLLKQRWFFRWEMHHLLHRANFRVEALYGGYHGQSPGGLGSEMIWVARRANERELSEEVAWLSNQLARIQEQQAPNMRSRRRR